MTTIWPLRPNWRGSYRVRYQFKTEIITSRSGKEQRRALRASPRKNVEFLVTTQGDRFRALLRDISLRQGELTLLPEVSEGVRTTEGRPANAFTFQVERAPPWLIAGAEVLLVDGDYAEPRTVAGVVGQNVTFTASSARAWPGRTLVCPQLSVRAADSFRSVTPVSGLAEGRISFDVDPISEPLYQPPVAPAVWNGREVFMFGANWAGSPDITFTRTMATVDYGFGPTATFFPEAFGSRLRTYDYVARSPDHVETLRNFFLRAKGRRGEFYAPTSDPDILLAANVNGGASTLQAVGTDLAAAYADSPVFQAISVLMTNGQRFYRAVTGLAVSGNRSVLTLGQPVPFLLTPDTVRAISWMPVCRLASDEMTLDWQTDRIAKTRFTFQSLPTYQGV